MAQFRFQVRDSSGKVRQGKIEAASQEEAKDKLLALHLQVLELSALTLGRPSSRAAPLVSDGPVWDAAWEAVNRRSQTLLAGMLTLGLVWFLGGLLSNRQPPPAASVTASPLEKVKISIAGQLFSNGLQQNLDDITLEADFPDLPFHASRGFSQIRLSPSPAAPASSQASADFRWELQFEAARQPKRVVIRGYKLGSVQSSPQELPFSSAVSVTVRLMPTVSSAGANLGTPVPATPDFIPRPSPTRPRYF